MTHPGSSLAEAVRALRAGGIVAYPTEAVYGLGCDPQRAGAVARLFALKQRPAQHAVLLIGADFDQIADFIAPLPAPVLERVRSSWPGPITYVFPAAERVPSWLRGALPGIALRVTAHPIAAALCQAFGGALVSTSANRHGEAPARDAAEVRAQLGTELDAIVEGAVGDLTRPTPIHDALSGAVLRA